MPFLNDKQKKKLNEFVTFVVREQLKIKECPSIAVQNGRGKIKTTASYDYTQENKIIRVNGKNRALVDIMRSIAHELVHHKQFEQGRLKVKPPDIGGEIEDEANAKAGQYIKMFAKDNPSIYDEDGDEDINEQEDPEAAQPTPGTSDSQKGDQKGYPEVTTWSDIVGSKLTRGVANKINNEPRPDLVNRDGPANQLK